MKALHCCFCKECPHSSLKRHDHLGIKKQFILLESSYYLSGLAKSGLLGVWGQLLCLTLAVLPALLEGVSNSVVTHLLVTGLVLSRIGLWLFDLCVNQLIQEGVHPNELGMLAHASVQNQLHYLVTRSSVASTVIYPLSKLDPSTLFSLLLIRMSSRGY